MQVETLNALVSIGKRYPHLQALCLKAVGGDKRALRVIQTNAGMLEAPSDCKINELRSLFDERTN